MNKKNILFISIIIAICIIILSIVLCLILQKRGKNKLAENKIIIEEYDEDLKFIKTIEINDEKTIKEIKAICDETTLNKVNNNQNIVLNPNIFLKMPDGRCFKIQYEVKQFCIYENSKENTKYMIEMPEGLVNIIYSELKNN